MKKILADISYTHSKYKITEIQLSDQRSEKRHTNLDVFQKTEKEPLKLQYSCQFCFVLISLLVPRTYDKNMTKFVNLSFQEYVSDEISRQVFYGYLVYKLRRVKGASKPVLSGTKIVKRLRSRKYDQLFIKSTKVLVPCPSTFLHRFLQENRTLTNQALRIL